MKRLALGLALTAFALLAACSSKEEQAVDTMNEMADVLATVKDKSSAQAAAPKLKDLRKRMEDLGEDFGKDQKKTAEDMPPELKKKMEEAVGA
jgi:membrane-bound lytic murein transglycosylase